MLGTLILLAAASVPSTSAERAADRNVSRETAESYGCGDACYANLESYVAMEVSDYIGTDFDWDFYTVADNFSTSKPGDLLKLKPIDPTYLTTVSGLSAYRIQYVSEDLDGSYLPVTGFIALPYSLPASGKFPMVAFAHGTSGTFFGCSPSNSPTLLDYDTWQLIAERGYAVVATDYAGIGLNTTKHKYGALAAHAKDVFHSVTAARHAFGDVLSTEWVSAGHSQGGGTVWRLAEDIVGLAEDHDSAEASNYIGTVSLAPATTAKVLLSGISEILSLPNFHSYVLPSLMPLMNIGLKNTYPSYNMSILGDDMLVRMGLMEEAQLCLFGGEAITLDLNTSRLTTLPPYGSGPTASDAALLEDFNKLGVTNEIAIHRPMLLIQGVNDTTIPADGVEETFTYACNNGSEVHLRLYPKEDHSSVVVAAASHWLDWVGERFEVAQSGMGSTTSHGCSKVTVDPFDYDNVRVVYY